MEQCGWPNCWSWTTWPWIRALMTSFLWLTLSWKAEGWEDCSRTCNGGNRTREIKCMQVAADGVEYDVDPRLCSDPKPATMESCNNVPCRAEWVAEPFGEVTQHLPLLRNFYCVTGWVVTSCHSRRRLSLSMKLACARSYVKAQKPIEPRPILLR